MTPARVGLLVLAVIAICYAGLSVRFTLVPTGEGLRNGSGGVLGNDFLFFYSASKLVLAGDPLTVFDQKRFFDLQEAIAGQRVQFPFAYPPHILLLLAPLALLPYLPALYAWLALTMAPFIYVMRRMSGAPLLALIFLPPLLQNAISGQNGALTATLVAGGIAALSAGRSLLAGLLLGCLAYKPQVFVLAPICLLACRDVRAFVGLCITGLGLPLLGLAAFGVDIWRQFIEHLPEQMSYVTSGRMPRNRFATVFIMFLDFTGNETIAKAVQALSTLCAWALVYWCWRRTRDVFARALAFAVAMPLATPYLYEYDFALWSLPAAILAMRIWRGEAGGLWWLALVILAFLPPMIWIVSTTKNNVTALPVLALVPFVIWAARCAAWTGANTSQGNA